MWYFCFCPQVILHICLLVYLAMGAYLKIAFGGVMKYCSYVTIVVFLLLTSCASWHEVPRQQIIRDQTTNKFVQGKNFYIKKEYEAANQVWMDLKSEYDTLFPDKEQLLGSAMYYDYLEILANQAWVGLENDDVGGADKLYSEITESLRGFEDKLDSASKQSIEKGSTNVAFFSAAVSLIATATSSKSFPQYYKTDIHEIPSIVPLGDVPKLSSKLDYVSISKRVASSDGKRLVVVPSIGALANVGRLLSGEGWCTASLIGRKLALTNAHCVTSENDGYHLPIDNLSLVFNDFGIKDKISVVSVTTHSEGRWEFWDQKGLDKYNTDWAILELEHHPYGRGYLGWITNTKQFMGTQGNIFNAGFSSDLNEGEFLTLDWNCSFGEKMTSKTINTYCRGEQGSSGSPVMLTKGERKFDYIVNLHAYGLHDRNFKDDVGLFRVGGGPEPLTFHEAAMELRAKTKTPNSPKDFEGALSSTDLQDQIIFNNIGRCSAAGVWVMENFEPAFFKIEGNKISGIKATSQTLLGNWNEYKVEATYQAEDKTIEGTLYVPMPPMNLYHMKVSDDGKKMRIWGNQPPFPEWHSNARKILPGECR